jgi:hypothetical protein
MADVETLHEEKALDPTDESDLNLPPSTEFGPISNGPSSPNSRSNSLARRPLSRSHSRSNNGYGCDENDDSTDDLEVAGEEVVEKDPFEVHWENGDNDPMNPRSMSIGRKWLVVIIVSLSSLCV